MSGAQRLIDRDLRLVPQPGHAASLITYARRPNPPSCPPSLPLPPPAPPQIDNVWLRRAAKLLAAYSQALRPRLLVPVALAVLAAAYNRAVGPEVRTGGSGIVQSGRALQLVVGLAAAVVTTGHRDGRCLGHTGRLVVGRGGTGHRHRCAGSLPGMLVAA